MFFKSKKGIMGVGMLLIFIASIVSSAIGAALLITSTNVIRDRAERVQLEVTEGLITGFEVITFYAHSNTSTMTINDFELIMRLRAGSRPIEMDTVGLTFISGDTTATAYINKNLSGDDCNFDNLASEEDFCIMKIFGENNSLMESGDMIILKYKLNDVHALGTETDFDLIFQLRTGAPLIMQMQTPDMLLSRKLRLR